MEQKIENHSACIDCPINCCEASNSMIWITEEEKEQALKLSEGKIQIKQDGDKLRVLIPCFFLEKGRCKIYEQRFKICRNYGHCSRITKSEGG